jgi:uroporphyrinogen-III synthase
VDWSDVPLYSVGQSSADTHKSSSLPSAFVPNISPSRIAKTACDLLPLLLPAVPRYGTCQKSSLIIRGDKSLDEIPQGLASAGREFREVVVYRTTEDPELASRMRGIMGDFNEDQDVFLVFFSPSSAGYVLRYLSDIELPPFDKRTSVRVVAIGETTKRYLETQGLKVDATAEQPTPAGVADALFGRDETIYAKNR